MHGESSLQLIPLIGRTNVSKNAGLDILFSKIVQYVLAVDIKRSQS